VVSRNVIDPLISPSVWRLEVRGLVERPRVYRYEDLLAMPVVTQETTLECIRNDIGDGLMSNAVWKGVPMRHLLDAAHPRQGATEVLLHAAAGYTDTLALDKAMDPTSLLVYEMNGDSLPERHGFPARVIVPGLFGKNNVEWVTRIELVNAHVKGFYEKQGWGVELCRPDHLALRLTFAQTDGQAGTGRDCSAKGDCLCRSSRRHSGRGQSR
jgi:DMSO/TMAO reductase YedYZ molybdopterin-dependent catalytic subunit